ncbi:hypothetical protein ACTA71_009200 [Dictyostelium dimigraforme]
MGHISFISLSILFSTIFTILIVFIFTILINYGNGSYTKLILSEAIYQNDDPKEFGYFADFYKEKLKHVHIKKSIIKIINKIDKISNITWIITICLIIINIGIPISLYRLIIPSISNKITNQELESKFKIRRFLYRHFRISFLPLLIPICIIVNYFGQFDNFFINTNDIQETTGGAFSFCIISIVFTCFSFVLIIGNIIYNLLTGKSQENSPLLWK